MFLLVPAHLGSPGQRAVKWQQQQQQTEKTKHVLILRVTVGRSNAASTVIGHGDVSSIVGVISAISHRLRSVRVDACIAWQRSNVVRVRSDVQANFICYSWRDAYMKSYTHTHIQTVRLPLYKSTDISLNPHLKTRQSQIADFLPPLPGAQHTISTCWSLSLSKI